MTDYIPQVGDKVRATLGENVLVGEVYATRDNRLDLLVPDGHNPLFSLYFYDGWLFKQDVSVPTKRGAVVKVDREHGAVILVRSKSPFWYTLETGIRWTDQDLINYGFTVLFEGID